jgi:hypothetical protein
MSQKAQKLFQKVQDTLARVGREVGTELSRQGTLGNSELAASLFREHDGFVLYGPNAKPALGREQGVESPSAGEQAHQHEQTSELELEHEL